MDSSVLFINFSYLLIIPPRPIPPSTQYPQPDNKPEPVPESWIVQGIYSYVGAEEFADEGKDEDNAVQDAGEEAVFLGGACFGGAGGKSE